VGADGGGPLVRGGSEAGVVAPTCMHRSMRTTAASGAWPAGSSAWTGSIAVCLLAGRSCMHALWGPPRKSGRRRRDTHVPKCVTYAFLPHAEGARQSRGRAVGAGVRTDAAFGRPNTSLSLFLPMTRVC
jgi:hypothetical protein